MGVRAGFQCPHRAVADERLQADAAFAVRKAGVAAKRTGVDRLKVIGGLAGVMQDIGKLTLQRQVFVADPGNGGFGAAAAQDRLHDLSGGGSHFLLDRDDARIKTAHPFPQCRGTLRRFGAAAGEDGERLCIDIRVNGHDQLLLSEVSDREGT